MKDIKPYLAFSICAYLVSVVLAIIFDFSLQNTWQTAIVMPLVYGPLWLYGWKKTMANKSQKPVLCTLAQIILIVWFLGYIVVTILFFAVGW